MFEEKVELPKVDSVAVWKRQSKAGQDYMSGVVEVEGKKYSFALFTNQYKEKESHPDFVYSTKPQQQRQ